MKTTDVLMVKMIKETWNE